MTIYYFWHDPSTGYLTQLYDEGFNQQKQARSDLKVNIFDLYFEPSTDLDFSG
jgi:hypothetical protein